MGARLRAMLIQKMRCLLSGVMNALLTLPSFNEVFPEIDTSRNPSGTSSESIWQGLTIGLYESMYMVTPSLSKDHIWLISRTCSRMHGWRSVVSLAW